MTKLKSKYELKYELAFACCGAWGFAIPEYLPSQPGTQPFEPRHSQLDYPGGTLPS